MFDFIKKWFQKEASPPQNNLDMTYLIVGLGNIGAEYAMTRHNIGFLVLDRLASQREISFKTDRLGDTAVFKHKGKTFILLKPSTYMNLSGKALAFHQQKHKISIENVFIVVDDKDTPFEKMRIRLQGSAGGHNGLKHIEATLGTNVYNRLRIGIGDDYSKGKQIDFVLGEWTEAEKEKLPAIMDKATEIILSFGLAGIQNTMNLYNAK